MSLLSIEVDDEFDMIYPDENLFYKEECLLGEQKCNIYSYNDYLFELCSLNDSLYYSVENEAFGNQYWYASFNNKVLYPKFKWVKKEDYGFKIIGIYYTVSKNNILIENFFSITLEKKMESTFINYDYLFEK